MSAVILRRVMRFIRSLTLAALTICLLSAGTPSHARSMFWPQYGSWWGDHAFRHKHQHKQTKSDLRKEPQCLRATIGATCRGHEIWTEAPTLEAPFYSGGAAQYCAKRGGGYHPSGVRGKLAVAARLSVWS